MIKKKITEYIFTCIILDFIKVTPTYPVTSILQFKLSKAAVCNNVIHMSVYIIHRIVCCIRLPHMVSVVITTNLILISVLTIYNLVVSFVSFNQLQMRRKSQGLNTKYEHIILLGC